ncbi:MAG: SHD1 domain-containing protein [Pirellulaceae bacterium]|nr:SHD1 domain-containing protein [Pirellulaceae bacterium]
MNSEKQLSPLVSQFVPLKVDTSSPEWQSLERKYRSGGSAIPIIYVIRADGQKLYAKSGSLPGEQLYQLMTAAIKEMGRTLSATEAQLLAGINSEIESSLADDNLQLTATGFRKLKKLGDFGAIPSYAKEAVRSNALASQFSDSVDKKIDEIKANLAKENDKEKFFVSAVATSQLKTAVGNFGAFKIKINDLDRQLRAKSQHKDLLTTAKQVASAMGKISHKSSSVRIRANQSLKKLAAENPSPTVVKFIDSILSDVENKPERPSNLLRKWTSNDGKFAIEAKFLGVSNGDIRLERKNGEVILVPLSRLSDADQEFLDRKHQ